MVTSRPDSDPVHSNCPIRTDLESTGTVQYQDLIQETWSPQSSIRHYILTSKIHKNSNSNLFIQKTGKEHHKLNTGHKLHPEFEEKLDVAKIVKYNY